jgi:hypothetical protein
MKFSSLFEKGSPRVPFLYRGNHPRAGEKKIREGVIKNTYAENMVILP